MEGVQNYYNLLLGASLDHYNQQSSHFHPILHMSLHKKSKCQMNGHCFFLSSDHDTGLRTRIVIPVVIHPLVPSRSFLVHFAFLHSTSCIARGNARYCIRRTCVFLSRLQGLKMKGINKMVDIAQLTNHRAQKKIKAFLIR